MTSSNRQVSKIHSVVLVVDSEDFQALKVSKINLGKEEEDEARMALVIYLKSSRNFSVANKEDLEAHREVDSDSSRVRIS